MTKEEAIAKIEKLFALAGNNSSPEEAALAAARAQEIMERHSIMQAEIGVDQKDEMETCMFGAPLRRKSGWQGCLAGVVAESHGCAAIWYQSTIFIAGRPDDVTAAVRVRDFCHKEIDRLTAKHAAGRGRGYGISFRMGCVYALGAAIVREREALREELRGEVTEMALMVVDQRSKDAMDTFGEVSEARDWDASNAAAYVDGVIAGRDIHGQTKPRLEG